MHALIDTAAWYGELATLHPLLATAAAAGLTAAGWAFAKRFGGRG